ncbi:MAG: ABC transporter permease, partial [Actinomycetia bacterium]|nr:ABC transporter permease [Actinomycetes bacterium]
PAAAPGPQASQPTTARQRLQQLLAFGGLIVIYLVFAVLKEDSFATLSNLTSILFSAVVVGLLALGATLVIITGGIDLSVGTGMAFCAVMSGTFIVTWNIPVALGIPLAILCGGVLGAVNGFNIAILKLPPFIATLAMMLVCQGLALVVSGTKPIYFDPESGYTTISTGTLIDDHVLAGVPLPRNYPNAIIVFALAVVVAAVLLNRTLLGRYDVAIGSNAEATALSGVNVLKWLIIIYTVAGLFTGLAGVMISARLGSAQPATGAGYELQAIAAVVIGGTSLAGGKGSIMGTVIGALIIAVLNNGLQISSVPQEWQNVILGVVILLAVFADQLRTRREAVS